MRNRLIVALLVVAAVSFMPMSHARAAEDDVQGAKAAVGKFHEALKPHWLQCLSPNRAAIKPINHGLWELYGRPTTPLFSRPMGCLQKRSWTDSWG